MSPRRPSSPRSERRRARRDTSARPAGSIGTWTRRPSVVITTATLRRSCRSNRPKWPPRAHCRRAARAVRRSLAGIVPPVNVLPRSCRGRRCAAGRVRPAPPEPRRTASRRRRRGRRDRPARSAALGRTTEQVALAGADARASGRTQLLGRLDALGDDQRAPAVGEVLERADDLLGRGPDRAALDEREVDLDDVEPELATAGAARHCRHRRRRRRCASRPPARLDGPDRRSMSSTASRSVSSRTTRPRVDAVALEHGTRAWTLNSSASRVRGERLRVRLPGRRSRRTRRPDGRSGRRGRARRSARRPRRPRTARPGSAKPEPGSGRMRPS